MNWYDARNVCQNNGGDLASIHSQPESNSISAVFPSDVVGEYAWIDMQDIVEEGTWVWADGTPMDYENHDDDDSNNDPRQNCGLIHTPNLNLGRWDDDACTEIWPFVCRFP